MFTTIFFFRLVFLFDIFSKLYHLQKQFEHNKSIMFSCRNNAILTNAMKKMIYPLIALLVIAGDQITKHLVRANMQPGDRIPVIGDWMSIYYVRNTGTAFSMFEGNRLVTLVLTSVLILVCLVFIIREARAGRRLVPVLLTFVIAGGASNLIDRLTFGYVTDMISCGNFAVFNVADIAVTCGCVLTMLALLLFYREEEE